MKKRLFSFVSAMTFCFTVLPFYAAAEDTNDDQFALSSHLDETFSKRHETSEVDESLFDKFLKYSLLVTDKNALSAEELALCHKIFETERTYMPYITCPYARETIKNGTASPRISTDNERLLAAMGDPYGNYHVEYTDYQPDIAYEPFDYNFGSMSEYWCDNSGMERVICDYTVGQGPVYEKRFNEKPDWDEMDRLVLLCWAGGDLIEHDGTYSYEGYIDGIRFRDLLNSEKFLTSDIWVYQLLEDGSAYIIDCDLPESSNAEPIEEPFVLPEELDGHAVYGIGNDVLSRTGITKLVVPENYKYVGFSLDMEYLKEAEVNAPELILSCFLWDCPALETVTLNVKSIGSHAMPGCDNLTTLKIKSAGGIDPDAFSNLPSLREVTLPENLRYIGQDAFVNTAVTELAIPESVEIVGALKNPYIDMHELIDPLTADLIQIADADCVIKSYYNTEAHRYAIANHYTFSPLDAIPHGDVNGDNSFNIADMVALQKWLLSSPDTKFSDWKAADLCEDGIIDVFDLAMMKQALLGK